MLRREGTFGGWMTGIYAGNMSADDILARIYDKVW